MLWKIFNMAVRAADLCMTDYDIKKVLLEQFGHSIRRAKLKTGPTRAPHSKNILDQIKRWHLNPQTMLWKVVMGQKIAQNKKKYCFTLIFY